jgi:hypothetical protein
MAGILLIPRTHPCRRKEVRLSSLTRLRVRLESLTYNLPVPEKA